MFLCQQQKTFEFRRIEVACIKSRKKNICRTVIAIIAVITLKNSPVNVLIQKLAGGKVVNLVFIVTSVFIESLVSTQTSYVRERER